MTRVGRPLRAGFLGCGEMADRHLAVLQRREDVEVVAHVSGRFDNARTAASKWGGAAYETYDAMLAHAGLDALWICVPPSVHGEPEIAAVRAGIPLFIEKPVAADSFTAERVGRAAAVGGVAVGVAYQWRAFDHVEAVRRELSGREVELVVGAWHGGTPAPQWWSQRARSGGQIVEQATHVVDLARYLVSDAEVVCAEESYGDAASDVSRVSTAQLRFASGALGVVTATRIAPTSTDVFLDLYCEGVKYSIDRQGATITDADGVRRIALGNDPIERENAAFVAAVTNGDFSAILCNYADALKSHRLCCDIAEKAGAGAVR